MVHKYSVGADEDVGAAFDRAVIANAMRGGENVATGALMGAILGGAAGFSKLPRHLVEGLAPSQKAQLEQEVQAYLAASPVLNAVPTNAL